jgi:Domain of unknown function (DUF4082)
MKKYILLFLLFPFFVQAQRMAQKGLPKSGTDNTSAPQKILPPHSSNEGPLWAYYVYQNPSFKVQLSNTTSTMEVGYAFTVSKKGMVYAFNVYAPLAGASYTISFWDGETQQLLKQKKVIIAAKDNFQNIDFDNEAVEILPNKTYVVSINTSINGTAQYNPFYILKRDNPAEKFLPYTYKHITIREGRFCFGKNADNPVFPANSNFYSTNQDVVLGLVDVNYYPTEY